MFICIFFPYSMLAQTFQKEEKIKFDGCLLSATYETNKEGAILNIPFVSLIGFNIKIYGEEFPVLYGTPKQVLKKIEEWQTIFESLDKNDGLVYKAEDGFSFTYVHYSFPLASVYEVRFPTGEATTFGEKDLNNYAKALKKWRKKKNIPIAEE